MTVVPLTATRNMCSFAIFLLKLLVFQATLSWCNARLLLHDGARVKLAEVRLEEDITQKFSGLYSRGIVHEDEYEMVVPVRVDEDGSFVSHDVEMNHDAIERSRRRRSTDEEPGSEDRPVYYNITVGGRPLRLNLRPSHNFIGRALVVERHGPDGHTRQRPKRESSICHYQGGVEGQPESSVALSACQGLAGLLRTEHGEYWVEPSLKHTPSMAGEQHPHVIYKRAAAQKFPKKKGMDKKRRHGKKGFRRRGRRGKNCATKQPKRQNLAYLQRNHTDFTSNNIDVDQYLDMGRGRQTRSVSRPRHVEVLLVADSTMTDFHQKGNVETYLLTIMNMVSSLYLDPTIGNSIEVVVVKIILLDEQYAGSYLNITTNADTTLSNFCRWQRDLNPSDDDHPNHHDVAILITRKDICARQNVPCSTLGVAHVAGMCMPERSCSVNEDNGITLAHTITHELGHNFGMYHDTEKIGCHRRIGSTLHVMTPIFEADTVDVAWSQCSRRDLTNFLDSGMGECLADSPAQLDYIYPELPAGALYDAQRQCKLQFGMNVNEVCTDIHEICKRLWCVVNGTCVTMLRPAAPGTSCGEDMWCQNHECVPRSSPPPPEDGGWGEWSEWSECSRTCGAGVSITKRQCDNPLPRNGGKFCIGERTRYKICNTEKCQSAEPSFRQQQCSKHNNATHEWQFYFDTDEPCELYCSSGSESTNGPMIMSFDQYVLDGTSCSLNDNDMCISGICRKVGCDWVVDSNSTLDTCGVCNGNGTDCKQVQGIYSKKTARQSGYSEVALIPAGSRNIKIEEAANSKNFIGIRDPRSRKFYLNGQRKITLTGEYLVAGSTALYEKDRDWEKVRIPGPIKDDILIYQMIYRGKHRNPRVRYQYTVDIAPIYKWEAGEKTPCSRTCGGGFTQQTYKCVNTTGVEVDEEYCTSNNDIEKPEEPRERCNLQPCPTHWSVGKWSMCQCHKTNSLPIRRRKVYCVSRNDNKHLYEYECDPTIKPMHQNHCFSYPKCYSKLTAQF